MSEAMSTREVNQTLRCVSRPVRDQRVSSMSTTPERLKFSMNLQQANEQNDYYLCNEDNTHLHMFSGVLHEPLPMVLDSDALKYLDSHIQETELRRVDMQQVRMRWRKISNVFV